MVYTRGPLLWEHAYEGIGWLLDGKALQELQPLGHRLVNRAQLGPWPELFITTEGTYDLQVLGSGRGLWWRGCGTVGGAGRHPAPTLPPCSSHAPACGVSLLAPVLLLLLLLFCHAFCFPARPAFTAHIPTRLPALSQGEGSQMPRTLSTSVTKGTLHCWGRKLPLPVRCGWAAWHGLEASSKSTLALWGGQP